MFLGSYKESMRFRFATAMLGAIIALFIVTGGVNAQGAAKTDNTAALQSASNPVSRSFHFPELVFVVYFPCLSEKP